MRDWNSAPNTSYSTEEHNLESDALENKLHISCVH